VVCKSASSGLTLSRSRSAFDRDRFQFAEKILASLPAPTAMSTKEILGEASRRDTNAALPIRNIQKEANQNVIARDEAEMAALRAVPHKTQR
jgi:hypothetical protein